MKILEQYNLGNETEWGENVHRIDEAMRWAYAERGELGDPDFFDDMLEKEEEMLSPERIKYITSKITNHTHPLEYYTLPTNNHTSHSHHNNSHPGIHYQPSSHGTSHIVTSDQTGLSITLTSTVNLLFGSHLMVPETGVIMNNEMDDFSIPGRNNAFGFPPSPYNFPGPGKRPLSSITPVHIVRTPHFKSKGKREAGEGEEGSDKEEEDDKWLLSIGAAGGSRIPTATVLGIINILDRNMSLHQALKEKRFHDQLFPPTTFFEEGFGGERSESQQSELRQSELHESFTSQIGEEEQWSVEEEQRWSGKEIMKEMRERGHNITYMGKRSSAVQVTRRREDGRFEAASEPRQGASGGLSC